MRVAARALSAIGLVVASSTAHAQHYRVLVGLSATNTILLLDFSPCIPAEGSGCGGFLTRTIDASRDTTFGSVPAGATSDSTSDGSRIGIVNGSLTLTTRVEGAGVGGIGKAIVDPTRAPVAVAAAASRYAFAVLAPKRDGVKAQVRMFDLATRTAVASLLIDGVPSGIALAR